MATSTAEPLGHPTVGEHPVIDVAGITKSYAIQESYLERAVRAEARRALRRWADGGPMRLEATERMGEALLGMYRAGQRNARSEMKGLGVTPPVHLAAIDDLSLPMRLVATIDRLRAQLTATGARLERAAKEATFSGVVRNSLDVDGLLRSTGVRGAIDGLLPSSLTAGLADTYEGAQGAFDGWEYSAVLDGGTCDECEPRDGETYQTLDEAYAVLPGFGPNPDCFGGWRCRCRLVPIGPS